MKVVIKMPVLKAKVTVLIGEYDTIQKHIPSDCHSFERNESYMARATFCRKNGRMVFHSIIHSKSAAISVIAHEAVHASSYILDAMGVLADHDNDEFLAYMVQYICEEVEKKL